MLIPSHCPFYFFPLCSGEVFSRSFCLPLQHLPLSQEWGGMLVGPWTTQVPVLGG